VDKVARRGYKSSEQIAPQPATCFGAYCLVVQPLFPTGFWNSRLFGYFCGTMSTLLQKTYPKVGKS